MESFGWLWSSLFFLVVGVVLLLLAKGTFFTVQEGSLAIVERFGKFAKVSKPGLRMKIPLIDKIASVVSLRVRNVDFRVETKTADQAFVEVPVVVQFRVDPGRVREANYLLEKPLNVIADQVSDFLRGQVPTMTLEELFSGKSELAFHMSDQLRSKMGEYGYLIDAVLITDLVLDDQTRKAMQMRFSAQRGREAAIDEAEAAKVKAIKAAEAEAEARRLEGLGVAEQRRVIAEGLRALLAAHGDPTKVDPALVTKLMVMSQYFDSLEKIGGDAKVVFVPHGPGGVGDLETQLRNAIMTAKEA